MKDISRGVEVTLKGLLLEKFTHPAFRHVLEGKTAGWRLSVEETSYDTDILRTRDGMEAILIVSAINPLKPRQQVTVKGTLATASSQGVTLTVVHSPEITDYETGRFIYPADDARPEEAAPAADSACISPDDAAKLSEDEEIAVAALKVVINGRLRSDFTGTNVVNVPVQESFWRPKVIDRITKDYDRAGWKVISTDRMSLEFCRKAGEEPLHLHHPGHPPGCRGS